MHSADMFEVFKRLANKYWDKWPEQRAAASANDFVTSSYIHGGFDSDKRVWINIPHFLEAD